MDDDEQSEDYAWLGAIIFLGAVAWAAFHTAPAESTDQADTSKVAQPIRQQRSVRANEYGSRGARTEPQAFVVSVTSKKPDWIQVLATILVIGVVLACVTVALVRLQTDILAPPKNRPQLGVRIDAIRMMEGELFANETIDNSSNAPAMNAQVATLLIPDVSGADDFFRRADSGKTEMTPIGVGFVLPGKPQVYVSPIAAPSSEQSAVDQKLARKQPVTVVGRVVYQDVRGKTYETDFCFTRTVDQKFQACASYNTTR